MDIQNQDICENNLCSENIVLNLNGDQPKKKIKKWPFIIGVAVLLIVALVVSFWKPIMNIFKEDETKTVADYETNAFSGFTDSFIRDYESALLNENSNSFGTKYHFEVEIDDLALKVIEKQMPRLADLGKLNDISLDIVIENDGEKYRLMLVPEHVEAELPAFDFQFDPAANCIFVILDGFTNDYLKFDLNALPVDLGDYDHLKSSEHPSADALEAVLKNYYLELIALMEPGDVTADSVTLYEIEQNCTAHTATISGNEFTQLSLVTIDRIVDLYYADSQLPDEFLDDVDDLKASIKEKFQDEIITWTIFVDDNDCIIGRRILVGIETLFDYLILTEGEDIALSIMFADFEISGSGTLKKEKLSGKFVLYADGTKYLEIKPEDVIIGTASNGELSGSVEIKISDEMAKEIFGLESTLPLEFVISFDINNGEKQFVISYLNLVSLSVQIAGYTPDGILLPDGQAINGSDPDALNRWLSGMDLTKMEEELNRAGLSNLLSGIF